MFRSSAYREEQVSAVSTPNNTPHSFAGIDKGNDLGMMRSRTVHTSSGMHGMVDPGAGVLPFHVPFSGTSLWDISQTSTA